MLDPAVDQHFRTGYAGMRGAVELRTLNGYALYSCLDNDVLFRMQAATNFVPLSGRDTQLLSQTAYVKAVRHALRGAVVPCGEDAFILDSQSTDLASKTCGTSAHQIGDVHKIFRPGHALHWDIQKNVTR